MSPVEEITRSIFADLASISVIIPYVRILKRTLEKNTDDSGIRTMKTALLHSIKLCFTGIEENKVLSLATYLDPRFKDKIFSGNIIKATIKEMLLEEMSIIANASLSSTDSEIEGPSKSKRLCPLQSTVLLDVFSEIVADSNETDDDHPVNVGEVDRYLNVPIIDFKTGDPYLW